MSDTELRRASIAALAHRLDGKMGRTVLMKLLYFLQTLRHVPLGYAYRLYTYGPFDSEVLADLELAEQVGLVETTPFAYPGGYGYRIDSRSYPEAVSGQLGEYAKDLDWVVERFGKRPAADLEMASTIVHVDRTAVSAAEKLTKDLLVSRVASIKPHLERSRISDEVDALGRDGFLNSLSSG